MLQWPMKTIIKAKVKYCNVEEIKILAEEVNTFVRYSQDSTILSCFKIHNQAIQKVVCLLTCDNRCIAIFAFLT